MALVELTARRIPAVVLLAGTLAMLLVLALVLHMDLIPRHTATDTAILHTGLHPTDVLYHVTHVCISVLFALLCNLYIDIICMCFYTGV